MSCYPELSLLRGGNGRERRREKERTSFQHRRETLRISQTAQIHCGVGGVGWLGGWLRRRHLRQAGCLKPAGQATKKKKKKKKKKKNKKKRSPQENEERRTKQGKNPVPRNRRASLERTIRFCQSTRIKTRRSILGTPYRIKPKIDGTFPPT